MLVDYVRGAVGEAEALVAACHLTLCGPCQSRVEALEQAAGAQLESAPNEVLAAGALEGVLARLDEIGGGPAPAARASVDLGLPRPLLRYLPDGELPWRRLIPGIRAVDLPVRAAAAPAPGQAPPKVRLVSLHPGLIIPHHDHGGPEYTVVFSGGLRDHQGTCHRGDVAIRNPGDRHRQHVEPGDQCLALVVNEGDLLPTTWIGRLVKRIARE
jgi:putative transcriptional regulator